MNGWMQATGWTLVHFVWQGTLVALMVAATLRLGRRWRSNARYLVACIGLAAMLAVPVATAVVLSSTPVTDRPTWAVSISAPTRQPEVGAAWPLDEAMSGGPYVRDRVAAWLPLMVWYWCAGVVLLSGRMAVMLSRIRRLQRGSRTSRPSSLLARCRIIASRLGLKLRASFQLVESSAVDTPTVVGCVRPLILLPIAALANLSPAQVDAILAHELAHIRRHDYVVNLLQSVVETFLFYHPAVWWLSGRVRAEREHACDDIALTMCDDRVDYAAALAELETWRTRDQSPALAATQGALLSRVRRILRMQTRDAPPSPGWVATLALALAFTLVATGLVDLTSWTTGSVEDAVSVIGAQPTQAQEPEIVSKRRVTHDNREWHVWETDHFEIIFSPELERRFSRVASYAESAYARISADLTHDLVTRVPMMVFETREEFEQRSSTLGAFFSDPYRSRIALVIDAPPDQLYQLVLHELTHQFAFDIIPRQVVRRVVPLWVDEGLADYIAGAWRPSDRMLIRDAALSDIIPKMSELEGDGEFADRRGVYSLGHAAFEFIEERWGTEGVRQFLFSLRDRVAGGDGDIFQFAFGISGGEFDTEFEGYIRERFQAPRDAERPADDSPDLAKDLPGRAADQSVSEISPADHGSVVVPGGAVTQITRAPAVVQSSPPVSSPDGSRNAFMSNRDGNNDIYVVNVDGTDLRRLTTDPAIDTSPTWSR
jgi:beta-lactamase regulating signal transducer with metallopeptidase domain